MEFLQGKAFGRRRGALPSQQPLLHPQSFAGQRLLPQSNNDREKTQRLDALAYYWLDCKRLERMRIGCEGKRGRNNGRGVQGKRGRREASAFTRDSFRAFEARRPREHMRPLRE